MSFWRVKTSRCPFGASPRFSSHLGKKGREQFSAEKNRKIYGGNRFRNIKNMAGTHFLIGIGNQIGKIGSKKGPEFGIPPEFPEFRSDFPTKLPLWRGGTTPSARISMPTAGLLAPSPSSSGASTPTPGAASTAMPLPAPSPFHPTHIKEWKGLCRAKVLRNAKWWFTYGPTCFPQPSGTHGYGGPHHPAMISPSFYLAIPCTANPASPCRHHPPVLETAHLARPLVCCTSPAASEAPPHSDAVSWRVGSRRVGLGSLHRSHPNRQTL